MIKPILLLRLKPHTLENYRVSQANTLQNKKQSHQSHFSNIFFLGWMRLDFIQHNNTTIQTIQHTRGSHSETFAVFSSQLQQSPIYSIKRVHCTNLKMVEKGSELIAKQETTSHDTVKWKCKL